MISIMILASAGILIGGFLLLRNVFDRIDEKWHDRWQYYKVIGVKSLRKAVTVALCIVSITFALIAGMCIPLDINVVSWWICGFHRRNDGFLKNGFGFVKYGINNHKSPPTLHSQCIDGLNHFFI